MTDNDKRGETVQHLAPASERANIDIVEMQPSHRQQVAQLMLDIRRHGQTYPPQYVENTLESMLQWLEIYPAVLALVAVDTSDGQQTVVGHVRLVKAGDGDPDVTVALQTIGLPAEGYAESSRLLVAPSHRGRGIGRMLKRELGRRAWNLGLRPMSTVMITQTESLALNRSEHWQQAGSIIGKSGIENIVFLAPEPSKLQTDLIHSGVRDAGIRAVATGIEVSTTFGMEEPGKYGEFAYARSQNPTRKALEAALSASEQGETAMAFSSGLAAIDAVIRLMRPNDRVIIGQDAYGGTWRLLDKVWKRHGIVTDVVDLTDPSTVEVAWQPNTRMVICETPSNPTLNVFDIPTLSRIAHRHGGILVVDNTFATPYLQQPLTLGADVVIHSATKYLGGHSDVILGALITNDAELAKEFTFTQKAVGAVPGPFDSFLVLRGMRTLAVRVERQTETAEQLAEMLEQHDQVRCVHYPGLRSHPQHQLATTQMRRPGGMLSISLRGGEHAAVNLVKATKVFTLAESLGAVESLIEHPASMTHAANKDSELAVDPGLVRLSIGLEDQWVLARDLRQALDTL